MGIVNYQSGLKVKFGRHRHELQSEGKDLFNTLFAEQKTEYRTNSFDYFNEVDEQDYVQGDGEITRDSIEAVVPQQRRRVSRQVQKQIHLNVNRYVAQTNGMSKSELEKFYRQIIMKAEKRSLTKLKLSLIEQSYRENILMDTEDAVNRDNVLVEFPKANILMPKLNKVTSGGSSTYNSEFDISTVLGLEAKMANDLHRAPEDAGDVMKGAAGSHQGPVLIMSASAKADILGRNAERFGNSDYYGRDLHFKGQTSVERLGNMMIVTLEDAYLPVATTSNLSFGDEAENAGALTPAKASAPVSGEFTEKGCHKILHVLPQFLQLWKPTQYQDAEDYVDFVKNFNKKLWMLWGLQGLREFDVFNTLYVTPQGTNLEVTS